MPSRVGSLTRTVIGMSARRAASAVVPRAPSDRAWAVLHAPFELLARPGGGFLAQDTLIRFCVVRRLGPVGQRPRPGCYRLGLAFTASSPRGQHELDFEAEEAAILDAVGETRLDLLVEDTGDPEQLGQRLADLGGLPVARRRIVGRAQMLAQPDSWRPGQCGEPSHRPVLGRSIGGGLEISGEVGQRRGGVLSISVGST